MPPKDTHIIGHQKAQQNLLALHQAGTFPHAVLLHGPQGIGKRLMAEKAAQMLMCGAKDDHTFGPNFLSPIYAQIHEGSNADYHILTPEKGKKSISIDQTRQLLKNIALSSDTARTVIIDAAEEMTVEAANALLKTLEEPQPNIHFFLVCHQISKLLPTIISRCRPIALAPLSDDDTRQVLNAHLPTEQHGIDMVAFAQGRPGYALAALETGLLELSSKLENFMRAPRQPIILVESIAKQKKIPDALQLMQTLLAQKAGYAPHYQALVQDVQTMDSLNLTPAWVLEKTLRQLM